MSCVVLQPNGWYHTACRGHRLKQHLPKPLTPPHRASVCGRRTRRFSVVNSSDRSTNQTVRTYQALQKLVTESAVRVASIKPESLQVLKDKLAHPITALLVVSILWGTYAPALRFLYTLEDAPSPRLITAVRTVLSASFLLTISALSSPASTTGQSSSVPALTVSELRDRVARYASTAKACLVSPTERSKLAAKVAKRLRDAKPLQGGMKGLLNSTFSNVVLAGMELGVWNFLGTSLQAQGLQLTSATKGAFLGQITTVMTPCLAFLGGEYVTSITWISCVLGLAGSVLISFDGMSSKLQADDGFVGSSQGELLILLGCTFYSVTTVRLGKYAPVFSSVQLAAVKVSTLAAVSAVWLLSDPAASSSLGRLLEVRDPMYWLVLLYIAVGPGGAAALLQTRAQSKVAPAQAQVIFSLTPVWSALIGCSLLHGESMELYGWTGASVILFASILAAQSPSPPVTATQADDSSSEASLLSAQPMPAGSSTMSSMQKRLFAASALSIRRRRPSRLSQSDGQGAADNSGTSSDRSNRSHPK